ncbi:MAG: hypothetical protein II117_03790 [Clostridia bacterium]|nr:hypothetical protein [Clostridia bacterium]
MKRFFLIPLIAAFMIVLIGCSCEAGGSITTPTAAPSEKPAVSSAPVVTAAPSAVTPVETVAPVMPTEPVASPSASASTGN